MPMAQTEVRAKGRKPPAATYPIGEQWINEHGHEESEEDERENLPALCHRAGRNGRRRIHEHHLEEKQREHANVVSAKAQEETFQPEQPERLAEERHRKFVIQWRRATQYGHRSDA